MDNENEHIRLLIERFMEGETTLQEERQLAQFFRTHSVPDEWKPLKLMFEYFAQGMPIKSSSLSSSHEKKHRYTLWRWWYAAAAVTIIAISALMWLLVRANHSSGDSTPIFSERNVVKQSALESEVVPLSDDSISTVVVRQNIAQSKQRPTVKKKRMVVNSHRQDSIEVARQQGEMEQAQQEILADRIIMEKERRMLREEQFENRLSQSQMRDEMLYHNTNNPQPQPTLVIFQ